LVCGWGRGVGGAVGIGEIWLGSSEVEDRGERGGIGWGSGVVGGGRGGEMGWGHERGHCRCRHCKRQVSCL